MAARRRWRIYHSCEKLFPTIENHGAAFPPIIIPAKDSEVHADTLPREPGCSREIKGCEERGARRATQY